MAQQVIFQAITTKFLGATNHRGARIQAKTGSGITKSFPYTYELNIEGEHSNAAEQMAKHMGWSGELIGGGIDSGFAWVFTNRETVKS